MELGGIVSVVCSIVLSTELQAIHVRPTSHCDILQCVYWNRGHPDNENQSKRRTETIILPECELNHCCHDGLKKALQMVCEQFHSNNFHKAFEGLFFKTWKYSKPTSSLWRYTFTSGTLTQLLFSKSTNDLKSIECSISTWKYYRFELDVNQHCCRVNITGQRTSWDFIVLYYAFDWLDLKMLESIVSVLCSDWFSWSGWPRFQWTHVR